MGVTTNQYTGLLTARFFVLVDIDALAALSQCSRSVLEAVRLGVVCLQCIYHGKKWHSRCQSYSSLVVFLHCSAKIIIAAKSTCCMLEGVHLLDRNDIVSSKRVWFTCISEPRH